MTALRGLYGITAETGDDDALLAQVAAAHAGGLRLLQYRSKAADVAQRRRQAGRLAEFCRANAMRLIINDDVALAAAVGAAGVHLGAADAAVGEARQQLGAGAVIGATCKNDLERARGAAAAGADYLAFGAVYETPTKPDAPRCAVDTLRAAKREFALPVVAIGGITPSNAAPLLAADVGVDMVAVVGALFAAPDITAAAAAFCRLFGDAA